MKKLKYFFIFSLVVLLFTACSESDNQQIYADVEKVDIISGTHIVRAEEREKFENVVENKDADATDNEDEIIDIDSENSETLAENKKTETSKKEEKKETIPSKSETTSVETTPSSQPVHTHSYTSSVTTNATCGTNGVMTYTCSCGDSYTEVISATGQHNYTVDIESPATCSGQGYKHYICSVCQKSYEEYTPETGNHRWVHYNSNIDIWTNWDVCSECGKSESCTFDNCRDESVRAWWESNKMY